MHTLNKLGDEADDTWFHIIGEVAALLDLNDERAIADDLKQLRCAIQLARRRGGFEVLAGDSLEEKAKLDDDRKLLRAWQSAMAAASRCIEEVGETKLGDSSFLLREVSNSATKLQEMGESLVGCAVESVKKTMEQCVTMCEEARWPMDPDAANADWKTFKSEAKKTWLGFKGGDELYEVGNLLKKQLAEQRTLAELFGMDPNDEGIAQAEATTVTIDALVWCVQHYAKMHDSAMVGAKLARWARRVVGHITGPDRPAYCEQIPRAMAARFEAAACVGPGATIDSMAE